MSFITGIADVFKDIAKNWTVAAAGSCFGATVATLILLSVYKRRAFKSTGKRLKLYHFKVLRSSRCAWLVHGKY